jgi:hypothetical protein
MIVPGDPSEHVEVATFLLNETSIVHSIER